jgi:hypothetical protein
MHSTRSVVRATGLASLVLLLVGLALPTTPAYAASGDLQLRETVAGHSLKDAGANSPIALRPTDSAVVHVEVTNTGSSSVEVRAVRLDARVLGLAFFSYTTRVDLTLAPGATGTRTFALDLGDLDGQATGLLPAGLSLLGPDRSVLLRDTGTVDVKGKLTSVYGVFGLAVAAITALLLLTLCVRLIRRRLPDSRWSRALRFAVPGVGMGLTVTFTLGVVRVVVPSLGVSLGLLAGGLVVGFVLGYLTPSPSDEADRDELDERDVITPAPVVIVPTPPLTPPPTPPLTPPPATLPPPPDDPRQTRVVGPPPPPTT